MALSNNKQLRTVLVKQDIAKNMRKAAHTNYLPKVDAMGGYEFFSREISLLSKDQKTAFANLGTPAMTGIGEHATSVITSLIQQGILTPEMGQQMGALIGKMGEPAAQLGNQI